MPVTLNSSGGGSVTITTASTASTFTATLPAVTGTILTSSSPAITKPTITNYVETYYTVSGFTSTVTLDLANGTVQSLTLVSATALTITLPTASTPSQSFILMIRQPASGTATTATFAASPPVKWPGGTAPTITATLGRMDIITFVSDGTNWYASFVQNFTP